MQDFTIYIFIIINSIIILILFVNANVLSHKETMNFNIKKRPFYSDHFALFL